MSELSRMMRKMVTDGLPTGNPLVTLGLSANILDLGLTEDELYDYVTKDVARRLVMRFHPDTTSVKRSDVEELQRKYAQAYEQLRDRAVFERALAEFRSLKAEERSEMRFLRSSLGQARELLESYRSKEHLATEKITRLERERSVDSSRAEMVARMRDELASVQRELKGNREKVSFYRKKYEMVLRYVNSLSADHSRIGVNLHSAKWVVLTSMISKSSADSIPLPTGKDGLWSEEVTDVFSRLGISQDISNGILDAWKEKVAELESQEARVSVSACYLRLHIVEIEGSKMTKVLFGQKSLEGPTILGSIPNDSLAIEVKHLFRVLTRDEMFEWVIPVLVEGGLMVSQRFMRFSFKSEKDMHLYYVRRDTRKIILAAG